jgi:hypothetical protein
MLKCKHPSEHSRNRACGEKATYMVTEGKLTYPVCEKHARFYKKVEKIVPYSY